MPTDEMLIERFKEIGALIGMEDGEIEQAYNLKPGENSAGAFRRGTITSICKMSVAELEQSIADRQAAIAAKKTGAHYKGVAAGELPTMELP